MFSVDVNTIRKTIEYNWNKREMLLKLAKWPLIVKENNLQKQRPVPMRNQRGSPRTPRKSLGEAHRRCSGSQLQRPFHKDIKTLLLCKICCTPISCVVFKELIENLVWRFLETSMNSHFSPLPMIRMPVGLTCHLKEELSPFDRSQGSWHPSGQCLIVSYSVRKFKRIARSLTCAKTQSCGNSGETTVVWNTPQQKGITVISSKTTDESVAKIGGCIVCVMRKNHLYFIARTDSSGLQLEEQRLCLLDVLSLRESCEQTQTAFR